MNSRGVSVGGPRRWRGCTDRIQVKGGRGGRPQVSSGAAGGGNQKSSSRAAGGGSQNSVELQVVEADRIQWSCRWTATTIFSGFDLVQLRVAVAAAAQDTAGGAVVAAAGGATDEVETAISVGAAGGQQQRYFQRIDVCSCVVAAALARQH